MRVRILNTYPCIASALIAACSNPALTTEQYREDACSEPETSLDAEADSGQDAGPDMANPAIDLGQDASTPECTTKIYYGAYGEGFFEAPGINTGTYCATPCIGPALCADDNDCFVEQCSKPRCIKGRCQNYSHESGELCFGLDVWTGLAHIGQCNGCSCTATSSSQ